MDLYNPSLVATLRRSTLNAVSSLLARRLVMAIVVLMGVAPFISAQQAEPPRHWVVCDANHFEVGNAHYYISKPFYIEDYDHRFKELNDGWTRYIRSRDPHTYVPVFACYGFESSESANRYKKKNLDDYADANPEVIDWEP